MDAGVLADVEPREVEAEDLDLADDVAQVPRGGQPAAARAQAALGPPQVGEQLGRRAVALGRMVAGRPDALAHERERAPVGLLGVELVQLLGELREALGARCEQSRQPLRGTGDALGQRDPLGEQPMRSSRKRRHCSRMRRERLERHGGRHVRVAVAVAADPRAEGQQRRHDRRLVRVGLRDSRLEVAVERGHLVGERRLEEDEPTAHLVEDRRRHGAQLVRAPQLLHGRQQPPARPGHGAGQPRALVELAQDGEDARELLERRATARLRRMGGEDEPQLGAPQQHAQLRGARALAAPGAARRRAGIRAAGPAPRAARARAAGARARCPRRGSRAGTSASASARAPRPRRGAARPPGQQAGRRPRDRPRGRCAPARRRARAAPARPRPRWPARPRPGRRRAAPRRRRRSARRRSAGARRRASPCSLAQAGGAVPVRRAKPGPRGFAPRSGSGRRRQAAAGSNTRRGTSPHSASSR